MDSDMMITIPHNPDAEQALLGSILINPQCLYDVIGFINPNDFYVHRNRFVYEAILNLASHSIPVDFLTLKESLNKSGRLDEVGGVAYLTGLITRTATSLNVEAYGRTLEDYSIRRSVIDQANKMVKAAFDLAKPFDSGDFIDEILKARKSSGRRMLADNLSAWFDWYQDKLNNPGALSGYSTGLVSVDDMTDGLEPGTSTIIFGLPGLGKSMLCDQIALNISHKWHVCIYTLEIDDKMILNRLISNISGVKTVEIKRGNLSDIQQSAIADAFYKVEHEYKVNIINDVSMTTQGIRADIMRRRSQGQPVDMIVVDYIGLLNDPIRNGEDELDRQERCAKSIVKVCKDLGVASLLVHTLNKNKEIAGRMGILYSCDNAISMYRTAGYSDDPEGNRNVTLQVIKIRDQNNTNGNSADLIRRKEFPFFDEKPKGLQIL